MTKIQGRIVLDDTYVPVAPIDAVAFREKTLRWFNEVLLARLTKPNGAIVIITSRVHEQDTPIQIPRSG